MEVDVERDPASDDVDVMDDAEWCRMALLDMIRTTGRPSYTNAGMSSSRSCANSTSICREWWWMAG